MRSPALRTFGGSSPKSTRGSMARASLPPGFRFHPTDVELIMYYLKRKVLGKKLEPEAIAEVNIYSFSPWDLPDKSCIKNKDLEWFFFCPRERKYSSGARVKRATENGYWKTTGKERPIVYNDRTVGLVKTLIFHLGHAPKGDRTDWVIHEYRIIDDQLVAAGVQDSYVLCKIFQKSGLGPKNGAQYGAPFDEAEWDNDDDDVIDSQYPSVSFVSGDPSCVPLVSENESASAKGLFDPKGARELPLIGDGPTERQSSIPNPLDNNASTSQVPLVEGAQSASEIHSKALENIGSISRTLLVEGTPSALEVYPKATYNIESTSVPASNEEPLEMTEDELFYLVSAFTDDGTLLDGENGCHKGGDGKMGNEALQCLDGHGIFNGLGDLDNCSVRNEGRFTKLDSQKDDYPLYNLLPEDNFGYIELDDLLTPLDNSAIVESDMLYDNFGSYHNKNMQHFVSQSSSCINHQHDNCGSHLPVLTSGSNSQMPVLPNDNNNQPPLPPSGNNNQPPFLPYGSNQLPVLPCGSNYQLPELPYGSNKDTSCLDELQMVNGFHSSSNDTICDFDFAQSQLVNGENRGRPSDQFTQRGKQICAPGLSLSTPSCSPIAARRCAPMFCSSYDSSIHIKAEVTYGTGECTKEALSGMMEESSSLWNHPWANVRLLLHLVDCGSRPFSCSFSVFIYKIYVCHLSGGNSNSTYFVSNMTIVVLIKLLVIGKNGHEMMSSFNTNDLCLLLGLCSA